MFLKTVDATLLVTACGPGPRTIVAHGGFIGSGELWAEPFAALSRTWRTVTYDHRGSGVTRHSGRITGAQLMADLDRVLEATGGARPVLAGESMGAKIVLASALRSPERFSGMVIVDGAWMRGPRPGPAQSLIAGCRSDYRTTIDAFIDACVVEPDGEDARRWGRQIAYRSNGEAAAQLLEAADEIEFSSTDLRRLTLPVLVIHGSHDGIVPVAAAERLCSHLPNAELKIIAGAGHVPTITRAAEVAQAIETFFGSLSSGASATLGQALD